MCMTGVCSGPAKPCTSPPAPACVDASTLRAYASPGLCSGGACSYPFADTVCLGGCAGGVCVGSGPLAAGEYHTCAVTSGGGLKCWGWNDYGQLGDGTTMYKTTPAAVSGLSSGVTAVAAGEYHTCAVTSGGGLKCWGRNLYGQLGDGTTVHKTTPAAVSGLSSGVAAVAVGDYHTCAVISGGGLECWGWNAYGGLGDGTNTSRTTPVPVVGF
jgi:hypothetical protein